MEKPSGLDLPWPTWGNVFIKETPLEKFYFHILLTKTTLVGNKYIHRILGVDHNTENYLMLFIQKILMTTLK